MNNQWEKKTTRAFLSTQHNPLCQGCIRFKLNLLLDCRIHDTVDVLEMHKSKARNSRWKGFIIKSNAKQWNNDMCCMSCLGTEWPSVVSVLHGPFSLQDDKQQSAQSNGSTWRGMFPGVTFTLSSNFWGSAEAPSHCKPHLCKILLNTYIKRTEQCWNRGKRWDVPHLTNNHFYDHLCNTWLSPYSSTELYDESCNRLLQVTAEGPHHFWNSMRAASSSSAAVYVSDVEAGTVAITHIPSYASQGQHWKVTWDVTSPITKGAVGQLRSQHHHMLISWLQSPPTLSSEVSRTDFGALGYKWRIPGEADRIRYKIAKNLWCRLKANPFQPQPFCEIFYTGSFGDLSNPPPRGTWKAGWKYQSCIPEVNITIPLGTYTPRPADISASLISRVST